MVAVLKDPKQFYLFEGAQHVSFYILIAGSAISKKNDNVAHNHKTVE